MDGSLNLGVFAAGVLDYWNLLANGVAGRFDGTFRQYYLTDHLGSTRVVTDILGNTQESYDYYPFGLRMPGRGLNSGTKELFTGKERDAETGLDYFGARFYHSAIGRWLSVDPMADKHPAWSPYNYVLNNPIILIDPKGQQVRSDSPGLTFRGIYERAEQTRRVKYGSGGLLHTPELKALYGGTVFGGSAVIAGMALGPQLLTAGLANAPRLNRAANRIIEAVSEAPEGTVADEAAGAFVRAVNSEGIETVARALKASDLGIKGSVESLQGTFSLSDDIATVQIDFIKGDIENPFQIIRNLTEVAKKEGASKLRIQSTIANEKLFKILAKRYGLRSEGRADFIDIIIE